MMPIVLSIKIRYFSKVTQILPLSKVSLFKILENAQKVLILMQIANLQEEDLKIFKSDTFENYKCFVPVEVQNHSLIRFTLFSVENNKFSNSIGGATIRSFTSLV